MNLFKKNLLFAAILFSCMSCNNDAPVIVNPSPLEQWSTTLKGDRESLGAYPDLFVNYWEYTYNVSDYQDVALCIKGSFPNARFFSFTLYNDKTGDAIEGLDDFEIVPDEGYDNPFLKTSTLDNTFTIYLVPESMDEAILAQIPSKNICKIQKDIERAAICIRQYLSTNKNKTEKDEYGGVELPAISALNIHTLKEVAAPPRTQSNIDNFRIDYSLQESDNNRDMPFFLATKGQYYPNYSTDYLFGRTILNGDSILMFQLIPEPTPKSVTENVDANARYWSICLGSALNTRSYYSVYDEQANVKDDEICTFIICLKQNSKLKQIQDKVKALNETSENVQLIVWDSEKLDIDNKPIGNTIVTMYRNILPNKNWEYSMTRMTPMPYGDPVNNVTDKNTQIAHLALGKYGPYGYKYHAEEFLEVGFKLEIPDYK